MLLGKESGCSLVDEGPEDEEEVDEGDGKGEAHAD
jgi:hypothetical protein